MTGRPRWLTVLLYLALVLAAVFFVIPVLWTLVSSFKPENDIQSYPPQWIPHPFTTKNYAEVLGSYPYLRWMLNSIVISVLGTVGILICSTLAAYALARFQFPGRRMLFQSIIVMLLIPIQAYVIPLYLMAARADLLNTYPGLILPLIANVTSIFILHAFFKALPSELEQAARIDGASTFRILWSIIVPLVRPALSVLAFFSFLASWNSFLWPLIILNTASRWTIPLGLAGFSTMTGTRWELLMAGCILTIVPTIIVVALAQKQLVKAIGAGAFGGR